MQALSAYTEVTSSLLYNLLTFSLTLFTDLPTYPLTLCLPTYLFIHLLNYLLAYLSTYHLTYFFTHLPACFPTYLPYYPPTNQSTYSTYLPILPTYLLQISLFTSHIQVFLSFPL